MIYLQVRMWSEEGRANKEPQYAAIWASEADFDEILISPVMVQDHMPAGVINAVDNVSGVTLPYLTANNNVEITLK